MSIFGKCIHIFAQIAQNLKNIYFFEGMYLRVRKKGLHLSPNLETKNNLRSGRIKL